MRIAISILLALLLVACEQGFSKRAAKPDGASRYVHSKFRSYFHSIAPAEYLGEDWQASGVDSVRRIWASSGGDRALILLRGAGAPALWLNRESSRMGRPLRLEHAPLYVDVQRGVAYAADGARLLERKLPEGEWETRFGADGRGEVLAVAGHAMGESVWVVLDETQTASELAKEREEQHVLDSGATPPLPEPVKEVHGDPDKPVRTLTAARLIGDELQTMQLPAGDPDAAVQLVALKDGTAFATVGSSAYLLDPAAGSTLAQEVYAGEGRLLLAADLMDNVAWVYAPPQGASSGTGRGEREAVSGAVIAFDAKGAELARLDAGQVRFSQLAGDWAGRRALLARDGAGVLALDFNTNKAAWALRDGGEAALELVGGGAQLWALLPDGISAIGANQLLKLGPSLAAAQVLPRDQVKPVRAAVEALGWDWKSVQVSPLAPRTGRVTLFNAADPAGELAELDWSPSRRHVSRLLIARPASEADAQFAALPAEAQAQRMQELAGALGWPDARIDELRSVSGEGEATYRYALSPEAREGYSPGELSLWQGESVLLTLDAPTAALPDNVLALDAAKQRALEVLEGAGPSPRPGDSDSTGRGQGPAPSGVAKVRPAIKNVRAGWVLAGRSELLPEAEGEAQPAYEVLALAEQPDCREYRLLLDAGSGELLALHERACGPGR